MKAFGNQTGFVSLNTAIRFTFNLKNPSTSNKFHVGLMRNQRPCTRIKAVNLAFIASLHCGLLETSVKHVGSTSRDPVVETKALGGGLARKSVGRDLGL